MYSATILLLLLTVPFIQADPATSSSLLSHRTFTKRFDVVSDTILESEPIESKPLESNEMTTLLDELDLNPEQSSPSSQDTKTSSSGLASTSMAAKSCISFFDHWNSPKFSKYANKMRINGDSLVKTGGNIYVERQEETFKEIVAFQLKIKNLGETSGQIFFNLNATLLGMKEADLERYVRDKPLKQKFVSFMELYSDVYYDIMDRFDDSLQAILRYQLENIQAAVVGIESLIKDALVMNSQFEAFKVALVEKNNASTHLRIGIQSEDNDSLNTPLNSHPLFISYRAAIPAYIERYASLFYEISVKSRVDLEAFSTALLKHVSFGITLWQHMSQGFEDAYKEDIQLNAEYFDILFDETVEPFIELSDAFEVMLNEGLMMIESGNKHQKAWDFLLERLQSGAHLWDTIC